MHTLAWYDLVPVLSWIALQGRCRYCAARISIQYPLVELVTAGLFGLLFAAPFPVEAAVRAVFCIIAALLVVITVYDMRHTIIPDTWVYLFAALSFVVSVFLVPLPLWGVVLGGIVTAGPLFALWGISQGRWMGFGDVKLGIGMGFLLGPITGLFATFFAFVIGSAVLVPMMLFARMVTHIRGAHYRQPGLTMKSEVPFGPFLVASTLIVWISLLYGYDIPALVGW
jgi:leader peptidase (prepilin peptidase)/N-methyltransferase